ncbi:MAG: GNAT family N-acetyltransferase [Bacteroidetes bacterium]|nr:GNAT family N-acetyltransferase [Bacteroidota bacterium]
MNYTIREIKYSDLGDITELCGSSMPRDSLTNSLLRQKIFDDNDFSNGSTLLAFSSGKLIGFIMAVIRQRENGKQGYIKLLATHPQYRRNGLARELYTRIENKFIENQIKSIRLFESWPNYYMPGLDPFYTEAICFFERMGYKKIGDTSNLSVELSDKNFSTDSEELEIKLGGINIRRAVSGDFDSTLNWIDKNFNAWRGEVEAAFKNNPISIHLAFRNNEIIAFSAYDTNNIGLGWFGPMGTTEAARGKGVGGMLLKRCIADMQEIGYNKAIIPWVGPIPFYMHYINSKVDRIFWRYEKILES